MQTKAATEMGKGKGDAGTASDGKTGAEARADSSGRACTSPRAVRMMAGLVVILLLLPVIWLAALSENAAMLPSTFFQEQAALSHQASVGRRRFVVADALSWSAAEAQCKSLGARLCPVAHVTRLCEKQDAQQAKKKKKKAGKRKGGGCKVVQALCAGKGLKPSVKKAAPQITTIVCSKAERDALRSRWLPVVNGSSAL